MRLTGLRFLGMAGVALLLVAACGSSGGGGTPAKVYKIGLVTDTGGLNDKSFNHLAYLGLQKAIKDFGIKGDVIESKTQDDYVPNLTNFATKGYDLVVGNGFFMQVSIGTVAGQFPNVKFAIIDGAGTDAKFNDLKLPNVMGLVFKEQEPGALVGVIAAMMEKTGKAPKNTHIISAVGGVSIPPVNHYLAGYKWAAMMEDPMITSKNVIIGYSNDFNDPAKCKGIAQSQIGKGAEFVFQVAGGCGVGALQAAGQAKVWSFGVDADQKDVDPSVAASALKKVDVAVYTAIKSVVNGSFVAGGNTFSLQNDGVGYQVDNLTLPADVKAEVDSVAAKIKAGTLTPPADIPA